MIYVVRVYTVDVVRVPVFTAAFRRGGLWTEIARLQAGHIHTDLLRNPSDSSKFLSIEFWTSVQALLAARRSPDVRSFVDWLRRQSIEYEGLGMFLFPPQSGTEATLDEATRIFSPTREDPIREPSEFADVVWS